MQPPPPRTPTPVFKLEQAPGQPSSTHHPQEPPDTALEDTAGAAQHLVGTCDADLALAIDLSPGVLDRKIAALRAQASQTTALIGLVGEATYRRWVAHETFVAV